MSGQKRLLCEYRDAMRSSAGIRNRNSTGPPAPSPSDDDLVDIILYPNSEENLRLWTAYITGPPDTPYEDCRFKLKIQVPNKYPHVAPVVHFETKVCHPNVHFKSGEICLDILKDAWTPVWTLESTCRAIIALLAHPAADSPLNCDAGNLIRHGDTRGFNSLARLYALECAIRLPVKKQMSGSGADAECEDAHDNGTGLI